MKEIVVILNPISGTVRKSNIVKLIEQGIDKRKFSYEIVYTEYAGHAEQLARQAADSRKDMVVAVGGDGTVNEVARGIIDTDTALGIIPCGSGNGLARHLMLPMQPKLAIAIINEMVIHRLDYGIIDNHPFLCTCGIGFDAFIADRFAQSGRRGLMTYVEKMLKDGLSYTPEEYDISIDDGEFRTQSAWLISCANASQYGNNAYIAPQASMKDGQLDIVIMEPFNILNAVSVNLEMINKTLDKNAYIHTNKGKKLTIRRKKPGLIHFDGEPVMAPAELTVSLKESGINVVVNSHADKSKRRPNLLQLAMSNFFNDIDTIQRGVIEQGKTLQKEVIEQGKLIQKEVEEQRKTIRKDIRYQKIMMQRMMRNFLGLLNKNDSLK